MLKKVFGGLMLMTLFGGPIFSAMMVDSSLFEVKTVQPGETYNGTTVVKNIGEEDIIVRVYSKDYRYDAEGKTYYDEPGTLPRSNNLWISFLEDQITIAPGKSAEFRYIVTIPDDPNLAGSYWSMIMFEEATDSILNPEKDVTTIGISQKMRYGLLMVSRIGDTGETKLAFSNPKSTLEGQTYQFSVNVSNTGTKDLTRVKYHLDIYSELGLFVDSFESASSPILFPGTSTKMKFYLPEIEAGKYHAQLVADCGDDNLFGAIYALKFE